MLKRYSFILVFFGIALGCQVPPKQNPLIGSWERDTERTVSELTLQDPKFKKEYELVKKVIRCEEEKRCARAVLEYTEEESITNLFDDKGNRMSREASPYHLRAINDGYKVVTEHEPDGTPFVREGNLLRFELSYNGFKWREYWRPHRAPVN